MKIEVKQGRRKRWHFRLHRESDNRLCAVSPMSGYNAGFDSAKDADAAANEVLEARVVPLRDVIKVLRETIKDLKRAQENRIREMQGIIDGERRRLKHGMGLGVILGFVIGAMAVHFT